MNRKMRPVTVLVLWILVGTPEAILHVGGKENNRVQNPISDSAFRFTPFEESLASIVSNKSGDEGFGEESLKFVDAVRSEPNLNKLNNNKDSSEISTVKDDRDNSTSTKQDLSRNFSRPSVEDFGDTLGVSFNHSKTFIPNSDLQNPMQRSDEPTARQGILMHFFLKVLGNLYKRVTEQQSTRRKPGSDGSMAPDLRKKNPYYDFICGIQKLLQRTKRIVGGRVSPPGRWPWMVLVMVTPRNKTIWDSLYCGGVLITNQHILTAAHCLSRDNSDIFVKLGSNLRFGPMTRHGRFYPVSRTFVHEKYQKEGYKYDAGILELQNHIELSDYIMPICLPKTDDEYAGKRAIVAGWGLTEKNVTGSMDYLREVDVDILSRQTCEDWFHEANHAMSINSDQICAGYKYGKKDACKGDSGGPLMSYLRGQWVVAGIVSHGVGCAERNKPGVYINVSHIKPWIEAIIHRNKNI